MPAHSDDPDQWDAVLVLDPQFNVLEWGPRAERLLGWTTAESVGRMLPELIDANADRLTRTLALIKHGFWEGTAVITGKSGEHLAVYCRAVAFRNEAGRVDGYRVYYREQPASALYRERAAGD
jgi:PAS domain S-box-containing protein